MSALAAQPLFDSDDAHRRWMFARLHRRLDAHERAHREGDVAPMHALVATQAREQRAALAHRRLLAERGVPLVWDRVARRLGLRPIDEDALALLCAMHLSDQLRTRLLRAQGEPHTQGLRLGFVANLLSPPRDHLTRRAWANADAPLARHGLLEVVDPPGGLRGSERLQCLVRAPHFASAIARGALCVDERLVSCARLCHPERALFDLVLTPWTRAQVDCFVEIMHATRGDGPRALRPGCALITGDPLTGKTLLAGALARVVDRPLFSLDCPALAHTADPAPLLELAGHNARLTLSALHIDRPRALLAVHPTLRPQLEALARRHPTLVVIEHGPEPHPEQPAPSISLAVDAFLHVERPDASARALLWETLTPPTLACDDDVSFDQLASRWELSGGQIARALDWACRRAESRGHAARLSADDLDVGARVQLRARSASRAAVDASCLSFDRLVLADDTSQRLRALFSACRNHHALLADWGFGAHLATGRGIVALLHGPPGTGKTLSAQILAHELGRELRVVAITDVLSKWVGEAEKNIDQIFREARASNDVLLFDEADALFGRRLKVERSQDQFQNTQVNHLLTRIEHHDGVVLLTTNLDENMDSAFARRILFRIPFDLPGPDQRERIWRAHIPPQAPLAADLDLGLDLRGIAEDHELSGGQIKNAAVRAAYACLALGQPLHLDALHDAAAVESRSAGKLIRARA